jgi:hypothetical protein
MVARGRVWRVRSCGACSVLLAWLGACSLDTSGLGTESGAMPGADDDDASSSEGSEPETSTGGGSGQVDGDTAVDSSNDASDGSTSSSTDPTDDGDETTGPPVDPCESPAPVTFQIDVTQALLAAPMQLGVDASEGPYAYSETADQGRASFELQVPCQAEFRVWARVYDPGVGANSLDPGPDSFFVSIDGESTTAWWYGCQMTDAAAFGGAWSWEPVEDNAYCIFASEFRRTLSPGTHLLHLTNREAGDHSMNSVAAVTRVVVTSDPAYVP